MGNKGPVDELKSTARPCPIQRIQKTIPMASACAGHGCAMGKASKRSGVGCLAVAADVDPFAREETKRVSPGVHMFADCRQMDFKLMEAKLVQSVHLSCPCTPHTIAGRQEGRRAEEGRLLEPMARKLCGMYEGLGIPMVTFENVIGVEKSFEKEITKAYYEMIFQISPLRE